MHTPVSTAANLPPRRYSAVMPMGMLLSQDKHEAGLSAWIETNGKRSEKTPLTSSPLQPWLVAANKHTLGCNPSRACGEAVISCRRRVACPQGLGSGSRAAAPGRAPGHAIASSSQPGAAGARAKYTHGKLLPWSLSIAREPPRMVSTGGAGPSQESLLVSTCMSQGT